MRLLRFFVLFITAVFIVKGVSFCQTEGQDKLLAKRAALVEAYRNLAEKVYGLRIDSQTYVRDYVAESDQIRTDLENFLKGAKMLSATYLADGTCEVEVEMETVVVVEELKRIKKQYAHLGHWKTIYFDEVVEYYKDSNIRAKGQGVARGEVNTQSNPTASIPGWEKVTTRGRLMAERAALVDGYRNMAERIKGLRIDSETYVRDFVAESDVIRTDLDAWVNEIEPAGPYRYLPGGICEVDVETTVDEVVERLVKVREKIQYWQKVRYKTIEFKTIRDYVQEKVIRATGSGVPPAEYMSDNPVGQAKPAPSWAEGDATATGVGVPPSGVKGQEARIMAERAAKVDAIRNLTERIYGVQIDSATTIKDFVTERDEVKAEVEAFVNGAQVIDTRYLPDGSVQVDVSANLGGAWEVIKKYSQ